MSEALTIANVGSKIIIVHKFEGAQLEKSIKQVSQDTGISVRTISSAIAAQRLPARRIGFMWVINTDDQKYTEFLEQHQKWLQSRGKEIERQE